MECLGHDLAKTDFFKGHICSALYFTKSPRLYYHGDDFQKWISFFTCTKKNCRIGDSTIQNRIYKCVLMDFFEKKVV